MNLENTYFTIQDPCGRMRVLPFSNIENKTYFTLPLMDPKVSEENLVFFWNKNKNDSLELWFELKNKNQFIRLGDFNTRSARFIEDVPLEIEDTKITFQKKEISMDLPKTPSKVQPFLTKSLLGKNLLWTTKKAAQTSLSVYIQGETGTGKEVIAHHIHSWSTRAGGPFVPLNCGALSESIAESELFGHAKGAFTGAIKQRPGAFLQSHGGTLFLDEVADLSSDLQVKLLRFLENGEIRPVGSDHHFHADVRVICATHKNLEELVKVGLFRQDLYYRLASLTLSIPSLRERPEDIELLAKKFCDRFSKKISPKALLKIKAYSWPGNVRELMHTMERVCGLSGPFQNVIQESDLKFMSLHQSEEQKMECQASSLLTIKEMERFMLLKALRLSDGNRSKAAQILGVARSTLFEMLKRHKVKEPKKIWDDSLLSAAS